MWLPLYFSVNSDVASTNMVPCQRFSYTVAFSVNLMEQTGSSWRQNVAGVGREGPENSM